LLPRVIVTAVIACVLFILAVIQIGSAAIYRHAPLGEQIYRAIDRVAPASYVNDMLAWAAMQRGDAAAVQHYAVQMPDGPRRDEWLALAARAQGNDVLAREYLFVATDVDGMQDAIARLSRTDLPGALRLEANFRAYLQTLGTHPDAVADAYAKSGELLARMRDYRGAASDAESALALTPHQIAYLLDAAYDEYFAGNHARAEQLFKRGLALNPACRDCAVGLARVRGGSP
jgi:tetratricopeptide (TPR) repeat protein